jgi:hypothetical protein
MNAPLTGNRCECGGCRLRFNSTSAFDLHRAGEYGIGRYCRQPGEMLALGMSVNELGFWIERRRKNIVEKRRPRSYETRSHQTLTHEAAHG